MKKLILSMLSLLLLACSSKPEGKYSDGGIVTYDFKSNGKVSFSMMGMDNELDYAMMEDGKMRIAGPKGNMIFTLLKDGSWQGPMNLVITKVANQHFWNR